MANDGRLLFLDFFAGTGSISNVAKEHGHDVYTIDWDQQFNVDWHVDISKITADDILSRCGRPDVIWASPDCTTFSVAAISKHRKKINGSLEPQTDYAKFCDECDQHVLRLIEELNPTYWFIENPRGGMRSMSWMKPLEKYRHTVTYCKYGDFRMKPTDIWTNHPCPNFIPPCKNGDKCHESAPRGSRSGSQRLQGHVERSRIPKLLCEHIIDICEDIVRKCDCCGNWMRSGYFIYGDEYYCSDDCLHSTYSEEEYEALCESDDGYWTEWS